MRASVSASVKWGPWSRSGPVGSPALSPRPGRYQAQRTCHFHFSGSPSPPRPAPQTLGLMSSQSGPASPRGRRRPAPPSQAFLRQGIPAPARRPQWKPVTPAPAAASGLPARAAGRGGARRDPAGPLPFHHPHPLPTRVRGARVQPPEARSAPGARRDTRLRGAGVHKFTGMISCGRHRRPACGNPASSREWVGIPRLGSISYII